MTRAWDVLAAATIVGSGLFAGVFFAFSSFVMNGLERLPEPAGAAAMRSMNVTAERPPLMLALSAVSVLCVAMIVRALTTWSQPGAAWLLIGAALTLIGALGVTAVINVPLNNRLNADAITWARYLAAWNPANHARTILCLAGAAVLLIGTIRR
ncbi:DUF1772 domain-containing protein [Actinoplanes subtropicus]|uniref:anthrone oxygenase family protein n=1 Tax=Actinoplanes subtropicus TaxID=543632 RepID=UPI00055213FD|nr:anthrone oxygenase family protein [Actinoplanes subtropicus]